MTKIQVSDLRTTNLTFEDIPNGSMFTSKDSNRPYIKMPIFTLVNMAHRYDEEIVSQEEEEEFNAVGLNGMPHWFDSDCEIESIKEIYITMK